ncbi:YfhO family protein [Staphylococcus caprae]|uniref:YfhO family protein n=1 Tax=Staphylococcus caprae TaxID=29380 RepID=UPI001F5779D9|nr:YfhO family protein [Staphylococcus caprae]MCI2953658.1 YfhO family protein [Staphylococcus caprae]
MKRILSYSILFIILSIIGHSYIIFRFYHDGILSTGPNDGMEQMVPIQMYLFNQWSQGNIFYSTNFGLGGDFFTDLSYYFSTNILFIINVLVILFLKLFISLDTHQIMFWMNNALIISVIKGAIAMYCTYLYGKHITKHKVLSIFIAFIFVVSPLYFRFSAYWPFFSDVFIWLPLFLYAIERVLQQRKQGLLIVTITLILVNNFYFAYYFFIIGTVYSFIRIIFRHPNDISTRTQTFRVLLISALLALGNSLFIFFHGVQSFMNNRRVSFSGHVPLFEKLNINTNIFFDNYLIVILFITIQGILTFRLYRHFYYRLFAIITVILIIFTFIPFIDQVFNGFSAPQKRWHFILAFSSSILVGLFIKYFRTVSIKSYILTSLISQFVIYVSAYCYHKYLPWLILVPIVSMIGLLILLLKERKVRIQLTYIYMISIIALSMMVSFVFIKNQIYFEDHQNRANTFYANSSLYSSELQRALVKEMKDNKKEDERIDWRVNEQDNTPMYQNFKGLSLYSSIFHHNILDYYYDSLKINLAEESLSRYQSTNGRQNIDSLFSIKYLMLKNYQNNVPSYFKRIKTSGQYNIYENQLNLPSVKVTNRLYNSKNLKTPLDREHAMLKGAVVDSKGENFESHTPNLLNDAHITTKNITKVSRNTIKVNREMGSINIHLPKKLRKQYKDFYLTAYIKRGNPDSNYTVNVNQYLNNRLYNDSVYRIGVDTQLYRTQPDKNGDINIQLSPKGAFNFKLLNLTGENYKTLKDIHHKANFDMNYKDIKNGIKVQLGNHPKGLATINIPYRDGMRAYINGHKVDVKKVNYMMTGVPVNKNHKTIIIKYEPPFLKIMIFISFISIIFSMIYVRKSNSPKRKMRIRRD